MATLDQTFQLSAQALPDHPAGGRSFDWPMAGLSLWLVLGTYLDGFFHHNLLGKQNRGVGNFSPHAPVTQTVKPGGVATQRQGVVLIAVVAGEAAGV